MYDSPNEPTWEYIDPSHIKYETEKRFALNYARTELTHKQLKQETISYLENHNLLPKNSRISKLDESNFVIVGKYAWIMNNNGMLSQESKNFFNDRLKEILEKSTSKTKTKSKTVKVAERNKLEGFELFQSLEDLILHNEIHTENSDDCNSDIIYEHLYHKQPSPSAIQYAVGHVQDLINQIKNSDEEHKASYGDHESLIKLLILIKNELKTYKSNSKIKRKAQKEKSNPKGKQAKKLKATEGLNYKKEDPELKLVSINPMSVIGSEALMVYNTKTRKVAIFYSQDSNGLDLRGTTIHNFDPEKSFQKILRKPKTQIETLRNVSLKRAEIVLNENIRGKNQKVTGRINEHIILMANW